MVNAVLAWAAMKLDLIGRVISVVPWTAPAPVGAAWALGWDYRAAILVVLLALVSAVIYFPFFKVYEKQLLAQEKKKRSVWKRKTSRLHKYLARGYGSSLTSACSLRIAERQAGDSVGSRFCALTALHAEQRYAIKDYPDRRKVVSQKAGLAQRGQQFFT